VADLDNKNHDIKVDLRVPCKCGTSGHYDALIKCSCGWERTLNHGYGNVQETILWHRVMVLEKVVGIKLDVKYEN